MMIDWNDWLQRWDQQQERYIPTREQRFEVMFDLIETYIGEEFTALDLGCGPASLSTRLVDRFPKAKVIAIDVDPMLLMIARNTIGEREKQITLLQEDLRKSGWLDHLPEKGVDVMVSTTALHWLPPADLVSLYYRLGTHIKQPGIFLDAEGISFPKSYEKFNTIISGVQDLRDQRRDDELGEEWDEYWENLKEEFNNNDLGDFVEERHQLFHWRDHAKHNSPSYETQQQVLLDAGFEEVNTIWQDLRNRVLMAVK